MHRTDLTNSLHSFLNSCVIEKGLSDFHETVATVMETSSQKLNLKQYFGVTAKTFAVISSGSHYIKLPTQFGK